MADFEYFNIMEVDPNFTPVEEGIYKVRINKMTKKSKTYPDDPSRDTLVWVNGDFVITDHEKFSGRRLFPTFWLSNSFDLKALRKVADRTGVVQTPGQSFEDWLDSLTTQQPEIKVKIDIVPVIDRVTKQPKVDEYSGKPLMENKINFREVFPAN